MDDPDTLSPRHIGARNTKPLLAYASLTIVLLTSCGDDISKPPSGIYVECDSNGANTYYKWQPGPCVVLGGVTTSCYKQVVADNMAYCYENDEWLAMDTADGETGVAEDTEGIYRANWPNHEPSVGYIRKKCTNQCVYVHNENSGGAYVCDPQNWVIKGLDLMNKTVVATELENPGKLTCRPWYGRNNRAHISPAITDVVPAGTPSWPSDGSMVSLACGNFQNCSDLFDEDIMAHLVRGNMTLPDDDEAEADYVVTSSSMSSSELILGIADPTTPSADSNSVEGRLEYSALDCGESTCPFYLGNLAMTSTDGAWDLYSAAAQADTDVTDVEVRLRRPTLGVWKPSTGEIYFGPQMLDLSVEFTVTMGDEAPSTTTTYTTNADSIFGVRHGDNSLELGNVFMTDGYLEASATLDFDSVQGTSPVASFMLPPTVLLDPLAPGLLVSSISEHSTDPDDDANWKLWLVDGVQVAPTYMIPAGFHTIRLEVRDSRFAVDHQEQYVMISYPEQGS